MDRRLASLKREAQVVDAAAEAAKLAWLRSQGEITVAQRTLKQAVLAASLASATAASADPDAPGTPGAPDAPDTPGVAPGVPGVVQAAAVAPLAADGMQTIGEGGGRRGRDRRGGRGGRGTDGGSGDGGESEPGALAMQGESSLSPAVAEALATLGLMDPTTMAVEEQDKVVGAMLTGAAVLFPLFYLKFGLLPDLLFSAVVGGGPAGLLALRTDAVGKFARDAVGGTTNLALSNFVMRAEEIDNEYQVTRDAQERLQRQIAQLSELRDKVDARRRRDGE